MVWLIPYILSVLAVAIVAAAIGDELFEEFLPAGGLRPTPAAVFAVVAAVLCWPVTLVLYACGVAVRIIGSSLFDGDAGSVGPRVEQPTKVSPSPCRRCRSSNPPFARYCRRCGCRKMA
jgi:hypothetical protein